MATAPSQSPGNSANTPAAGAVRPPNANIAVPSLSESPNLLASSVAAPSHVTNGVANGLAMPLAVPLGGSQGPEMRIYPRDGRVRNPIPSKLKKMNENIKGKFGVMHMDVASHRASEGRDAAAKRTSEGTLLQAKMAQTDGYVSHQRRANYPKPPGLKQFSSPKRSAEPVVEPGPPQPLTAIETKAEQARLLTLLRTLPHATVVDQICRGLAYFGGIPDAPPPADGKFPESAEANGSGSLFVGWIAELFPDLKNRRPQHLEEAAAQTPSGRKRPRGRPKGSKARKTRSDKGVKKGPQKKKTGENQLENPQDDEWIDEEDNGEDSVLETNDQEDLTAAETTWRNAPGTPSTRPNTGGTTMATPATGSAAGFRSINDNNLTPGSSAKKRGRPKGSKNRPKDKSVLPSAPPPKVTPVPVPLPMLDVQSKTKTSSTKSKPAKSRAKSTIGASNDTANNIVPQQQLQQQADRNITGPAPSIQPPTTALHLAAEFATPSVNGANTQNHESHQPVQSVQPAKPTLPTAGNHVKASTVTAKKRKRPTGNTTAQVESIPSPAGGAPSSSQNAQSSANTVASSTQVQDQASQHARPATPSTVGVPQAKRPRKSQESSSTVIARRQTPSNLSQKASVPPLSSHAEPAQQPSSEDIAQSHPPAEGLEAHYAAMQSHTDQIQSYSSRPQHKQQPQLTSSMGSTVSPTPAPAPAASGGLDAHYDHFTSLQNLSDNSRQTSTGRQNQQQQTQTASPIPTQASKLPQMSAASTSQQQPRTSQSYYSQGQALGTNYNSQQPSYSNTQRSQQHISNTASNTGLVQHVTNSPQFSTQSNSPLMRTDSDYRGSPSLMHNNPSYATRRPPSASPLDNSTCYRSTSAASHGVTNHSPHFSTRQTSTTSTGHNTSHSGISSAFPTFSESSLFDMSLDSGGSHNNLGIGSSSYTLSSGAVSQQQRSSSANAAPLYSSSGMNNTYLGSTNMGRTGQQNRWPS